MLPPKHILPLPPRRQEKPHPNKLPPEPLHKRSLRAAAKLSSAAAQSVVTAPTKLMDRINKELYKRNAELAVRNKTLALLRKLDEISLVTSDLKEMAEKLTLAIGTELGYDLVSLAFVQEEKNILQWLAISSPLEEIKQQLAGVNANELNVPANDGLKTSEVIKTEKPLFAEDLHEVYPKGMADKLVKAGGKHEESVRHTLLHPLRFGQKTLGVLTLSAKRSLKDLSQYEQDAVAGLVGLISLALYKAKIYEDLQTTTQALEEANSQLKDLDKAKSEFLSIASHQLNTPLTAIRGYISMLLEGDYGQLDEKQKPIVDIVNKSAVRLIDLIKNLLDISRIESGRLELNLAAIDLAQQAKELVQDLLPNALNKKLELEFHAPTDHVAHVVADQQRIRQVMLNIVDNAIKYTPSGRVDVYVEQKEDEVIFSVKDTGKGITEEEITRLFNKFTRVGGASRYHTEGTGLGLYVAKQIVKEHHGDVGVESPGMGKGSTFIMRLPIEGSEKALKVGEKASVEIKAAEVKKEEAAKAAEDKKAAVQTGEKPKKEELKKGEEDGKK